MSQETKQTGWVQPPNTSASEATGGNEDAAGEAKAATPPESKEHHPQAKESQESSTSEEPKKGEEITYEDVLGDPDFAREAKKRQDQAVAQAKEAWEAEQKLRAERAEMKELERVRAEKEDAAKEAAQLKEQLLNTQIERDMTSAIVEDGVKLSSADSLEFLKYQAVKLSSETDMDIRQATRAVIEKHPYLQDKGAPPSPKESVSTVPKSALPKNTQAPSKPAPDPEVDTLSMTPQQYREYRRFKHGLH